MERRLEITARHESWPLAEPFTISRGTRTSAEVVVCEIERGGYRGRGECVPYPRYGETVESVLGQIDTVIPELEHRPERSALRRMLMPGAARNALDCALWDLESKAADARAWDLAGVPMPSSMTCAFTLSLSDPEVMYRSAARHSDMPLLKMKVGAEGVLERVEAVRTGAPDARLILDANEAWTMDSLAELLPALAKLDIDLIEQPLPAGRDAGLAQIERAVPVAADESCHTTADLPALSGCYDYVNIKLDKTGGLTEALSLLSNAKSEGFGIMVGCMVGTSLAMAPAVLIGSGAEFVDLDGPLLLARDREPGIVYRDGSLSPPAAALWG